MDTLGKRIMAELLEKDIIDVFVFNDRYVMAYIKFEKYQSEYFELLNDLLVKNCSENRNSFLVKREIYDEALQLVNHSEEAYA